MKFNDLHITQQLNLMSLYVEGTLKPTIDTNEDVYHDTINDIEINLHRLRQRLITGWVIFDEETEDDIFIHYSVDKFKGLDTVQFFMTYTDENDEPIYLDRFGLSRDYCIRGDAEAALSKLKMFLTPFAKTDKGAAVICGLLDKFQIAINKAKLLPESFFDLISIDATAKIVLDTLSIATCYAVINAKQKHRRYTPRISVSDAASILIDYEREDTSLLVTLGKTDNLVTVTLTSSTGDVEGGSFEVVSEPKTIMIINTIIETLTTIVEDSINKEEYKPLLKRFLQYFNLGTRYYKNDMLITTED